MKVHAFFFSSENFPYLHVQTQTNEWSYSQQLEIYFYDYDDECLSDDNNDEQASI